MAAEITALQAHSVVGHGWFSSIHVVDATDDVDSSSATVTTISAPTHFQLRPNPVR
jgi:hypothetical protein